MGDDVGVENGVVADAIEFEEEILEERHCAQPWLIDVTRSSRFADGKSTEDR